MSSHSVKARTIRFIAAVNVIVATSLGIGLCTNWSWASHFANAAHAVFTLIISLATLLWWRKYRRTIKFPIGWCFGPALLVGILAVAGPLFMLIPPFTLTSMFAMDEIASEQIVQRERSPNSGWIAVVRYRAVGAYAPGAGRIMIGLRPKLFPFLERHIAGPIETEWSSDHMFIQWVDSTTIRVDEQNVEFPVVGTQAKWPLAVSVARQLVGYTGTKVTTQIDWSPEDHEEQPLSEECARWHVWDLRPGMAVDDIRRFDPDLEYQYHRTSHDVHLWQVVIWAARIEDKKEAPALMQWRFGYKGTLFTDSAWGGARINGFRLSAGAIPLNESGEPIQEVPVIRRIHERWGPPSYAFDFPVLAPVAESWSPPIEAAEVWVDETCGRVARVTSGDGPIGAGENQGSLAPHRYYSIELYDLTANGIEIEMFLPETRSENDHE